MLVCVFGGVCMRAVRFANNLAWALLLGALIAFSAGTVRAQQTSGSLTTVYGWGNSNAGVAFDMVAKTNELTITSIAVDLNTTGTKSINVYRKEDGFASSASWSQIFSGEVVSSGPGNATAINTSDFVLPANGRVALYVLVVSPAVNASPENGRIHFQDGTSVGDLWYENDDLSILQGYGSGGFGDFYATRNFQGTIYYTIGATDSEPPAISDVPDDIIQATDPGVANAVVNWTEPTATDASGVASFVSNHDPGDTFPLGTTTVTYTAIDDAGNPATASFTVTIVDEEPPSITGMPDDIIQTTASGASTAVVTWTAPLSSDNVGVTSFTSSHDPGATFPLGPTAVTYTATDEAGNTTTSTFYVNVVDEEAPVFTSFPDDIQIQIDYPGTGAIVTWSPPAVTDNVPGSTVTQIAGPVSGSTFPLGVTTVSYKAEDVAGNSVVRSFTVMVSVIPPATVTFLVETGKDGTFDFSSPEPELNLSITTNAGRGASTPIAVRPGHYDFSFAVPSGFAVSDASCSNASSALDPATQGGALVVASGEAVTCTIITIDSVGETTGLIGSFMESRAHLILQNTPDLSRRLERLQGRYSNSGGISAFGLAYRNPSLPFSLMLSSDEVQFASSLQRKNAPGGPARLEGNPLGAIASLAGDDATSDRRAPEFMRADEILPGGVTAFRKTSRATVEQDGLALRFASTDQEAANASVTVAPDSPETDPMLHPFDVWIEGRIVRFSAADNVGDFAILHGGADYLLTPNLLVGLGLQADWATYGGQGGAEMSGAGFLVGPYMTARLAQRLYFDARLAWGRSLNKVSPFGSYEDEVDAERWLVTAALVNDFDIDLLRIRPELRLSYFRETTGAYVDSLGVAIPSVSIETGTLEFGPTFSWRMNLDRWGVIEPYATVKGIWTFLQENTATAFSEQPGLADPGLRGRAEVGIRLTGDHQWNLSAAANFDGIGDDDFSAWGMKLGLDRRF